MCKGEIYGLPLFFFLSSNRVDDRKGKGKTGKENNKNIKTEEKKMKRKGTKGKKRT